MITFSFGKNWKRYVKYVLNDAILQNSKQSLVQYFGNDFDFSDKVFVDIGCGSGVFSLCALKLGVKRVISIDIDKNSIEATIMTRDKFGMEFLDKWGIIEGSILDSKLLQELQKKIANEKIIVYSWGVLHHTGNLDLAMQNMMHLFSCGGGGGLCLYCPMQQDRSKSLVA